MKSPDFATVMMFPLGVGAAILVSGFAGGGLAFPAVAITALVDRRHRFVGSLLYLLQAGERQVVMGGVQHFFSDPRWYQVAPGSACDGAMRQQPFGELLTELCYAIHQKLAAPGKLANNEPRSIRPRVFSSAEATTLPASRNRLSVGQGVRFL